MAFGPLTAQSNCGFGPSKVTAEAFRNRHQSERAEYEGREWPLHLEMLVRCVRQDTLRARRAPCFRPSISQHNPVNEIHGLSCVQRSLWPNNNTTLSTKVHPRSKEVCFCVRCQLPLFADVLRSAGCPCRLPTIVRFIGQHGGRELAPWLFETVPTHHSSGIFHLPLMTIHHDRQVRQHACLCTRLQLAIAFSQPSNPPTHRSLAPAAQFETVRV